MPRTVRIRGRRGTAAAPRASAAALPADLVADVLRWGDAFDAARCAAVDRAWRGVVESDPFWASWYEELDLSQREHDKHIDEGWAHTRAGVYNGPLKNEPYGSVQTAAELAYERTPKNAVVGLFNLRHDVERIANWWRSAPPDVRRSSRLARLPPVGSVVPPLLSRVSISDQLAWRRRLERASGGFVLERQVLEAVAILGGARCWNADAGLSLRLFTFEEIEAFLDSGGREPDDVVFDQIDHAPLRDKGRWDRGWIDEDSDYRWLPVGDLAAKPGMSPESNSPIADRDDGVGMVVVLKYKLSGSDPAYVGYVTLQGGTEIAYNMAPFAGLNHFLQIATEIQDDPWDFVSYNMFENSDDEDDEGSDRSFGLD